MSILHAKIHFEPSSIREFIGNQTAVEQVIRHFHSRMKQSHMPIRPSSLKAIMVYGPPGIGKTLLARLLAKENNLELLEISAATFESGESLSKILLSIDSTNTLYGKQRMILIDDLESIISLEKGISRILLDFIKKTSSLVYITCSDAYTKNLVSFRSYCDIIEFKRVSPSDILTLLKKINQVEKLQIPEGELVKISEQSEGDVRAAINDLIARNSNASRDIKKTVFQALALIFKSKDVNAIKSALSSLDVDPEMLRFWVFDNVTNEYSSLEEIDSAYSKISRSDIFSARIIKRQNWKLLRYAVDLATLGVAFSKKKRSSKFTRYNFPSSINLLSKLASKRKMRDTLAKKIGRVVHCSAKEARVLLPLMCVIASSNQDRFAERFGLTQEEITGLKEYCKNKKASW